MRGDPGTVIGQHIRQFFAGHAVEEHAWYLGPACDELPRLRVLVFAPGPRSDFWVYATVGAWEACADPRLEFFLIAPAPDERHVELLFMATWYHKHEKLGEGHTLPIGEPWLAGSACEAFLVSLPYPCGPNLELCWTAGQPVRVLWLLPITMAERAFKIREGLEALERRFDEVGLEYWRPEWASVV